MAKSLVARAALALVAVASLGDVGFGQGTVAPVALPTFLNDNGAPCNGCLLDTFAAGTTTPEPTFTDSARTVQHANPIVMNSAGRPPSPMFLSSKSYKFRLRTAAGATLWTADGIQATDVALTSTGELRYHFGGDSTSPITATSYPIGSTTDKLHAGTSILNEDSANLSGTHALQCMMLGTGSITISAILVNLSDGAPDTALVTITSTSATGDRQRSGTITFATSGTAKNYGVKTKVASGTGYVWGCAVIKTG